MKLKSRQLKKQAVKKHEKSETRKKETPRGSGVSGIYTRAMEESMVVLVPFCPLVRIFNPTLLINPFL